MQIPTSNPRQYQADTIQSLTFPYEWGQFLTVSSFPINTLPMPSPRSVEMVHVEVQDGSSIRFEINPFGGVVTQPASNNSPRLSGSANFRFGPNWIFSAIADVDGPGPVIGSYQTLVTTTPYTVLPTDSFLLMNVGGPAVVNLPLASSRNGVPLTIKDVSGNAGVNNITINAAGDAYGIDGNANEVLDVGYGIYVLMPKQVGPSGWMVLEP
jgi:hypothetical protein